MWTLNRTSRLFSISSFVPTSFLRTCSTVHRQSERESDSMRFIWVCDNTGGKQEPARVQQGEENLDRGFHRRRWSLWGGSREQICSASWQSWVDPVFVWRHWQSKLWSLAGRAGSLLTGWANMEPRLSQGGGGPVVARRTSLTTHSLTEPSIGLVPLVHWCGGWSCPGEHKHRQNQDWGHSSTPGGPATSNYQMFSLHLPETWGASLGKHLSSMDIYLITITNYISAPSIFTFSIQNSQIRYHHIHLT